MSAFLLKTSYRHTNPVRYIPAMTLLLLNYFLSVTFFTAVTIYLTISNLREERLILAGDLQYVMEKMPC